jgi:dipeptidyl-peptidase-4
MRFDDSDVPQFPLVLSDKKYNVLTIQHYPKAGDDIPKVKLGIIDIVTKKKRWIEIEQEVEHYIAWPFWTRDSEHIIFQWLNREQDTLKIYKADSEQGSKVKIYERKEATWVDFLEDDSFYLLKNGSGFLLRSNIDGWYHIYYYDLSGSLKNRLTQGYWNVKEIVTVNEENEVVYFHGAKENSTENHLYRIDFDGGNLKKLTNASGTHEATLSRNCSYFYDTYSSIRHPEKINLMTTEGHLVRKIGDRKLASLDLYNLGKTELFTIPTNDGYNLPAIWILPADFKKSKEYPVILSVYGGPDRLRVTNSFRDFDDYFLAQNGIIIIRIDHRGSGHFGKKGMEYMHRNLGKWEMHDLISGIKWLRTLPFIDSTRVGITGTSYGGYLTCMALTHGAEYFTHGVAWYPVTDWRWYDAVYTERYMDKPEDNYNGYLFGSPLTHANKYKGTLLITHGTLDDNVHFQHTAQFIQRLQDLNKHFELMVYVNSRHGYIYPKSRHAKREEIEFWFRHFLARELTSDIDHQLNSNRK